MTEDSYFSIKKPVEGILFKEKKSKFLSFVFPINSEDEAKEILLKLKLKYPDANHHCYAYCLGKERQLYRTNDDGEPRNTAGAPIFNQILSFDLSDVLLVVIRYFGGTKLGVGGLIKAYKNAAKMALEKSQRIEKLIKTEFILKFDYPNMNTVMRFIKENDLEIRSQKMEESCIIVLSVRSSKSEEVKHKLSGIQELTFRQHELP